MHIAERTTPALRISCGCWRRVVVVVALRTGSGECEPRVVELYAGGTSRASASGGILHVHAALVGNMYAAPPLTTIVRRRNGAIARTRYCAAHCSHVAEAERTALREHSIVCSSLFCLFNGLKSDTLYWCAFAKQ